MKKTIRKVVKKGDVGRDAVAPKIRKLLTKNPDITLAETRKILAKRGIQISNSQFYTTKSGFRKLQGVVARRTRPEETVDTTLELTLLRQEVLKLRSVIAALLQ
jgi:hypothetical protein